jgi:hypothetical protein
MRRTIITLAASAALAAQLMSGPALAQTNAAFHCPDDGLFEVRRHKPVPDLVAALLPPLAILNMFGDDSLAKLPTRAVQVRVVDAAGKPVPKALVALIYRKDNRFLAEGAAGGPALRIPHGKYLVNAAVADGDRSLRYGSTEVTVDAKGPGTVTVKLTGTADALAIKPLPAAVTVGSILPVEMSGGLHGATLLAIARQSARKAKADGGADDGADDETTVALAKGETDTTELTLPGKPGPYQIVATLCAPRITLARATITAQPARITIEAPERAPMGSMLRTVVSGTLDRGHKITIRPVEGRLSHFSRPLSGGESNAFETKLPYEAGFYEIKVMTRDSVVLASRTLTIDPITLPITGPDRIKLGEPVSFSWTGDAEKKFGLEIWTLAEPGKPARRVSRLRDKRVLAGPGDYELRLLFWHGAEEPVFGRKPVKVEGQAFVRAPAEAIAGTKVTADIAFEPGFFDEMCFYERGSTTRCFSNLRSGRSGRSMTADVPAKPGSYDLVYLLGAVGAKVEAGRVPIEVRAP